MSNTVDTRVVEMLFSNSQFESGVKTTLGTLDKLKNALNFNGATKGLEDLGKVTNKEITGMNNSISEIDFSPFSNALSAIQRRLSLWGIVGATIINNFTNKMLSAIGNLSNGLKTVFNQISTGGLNRALNLENAQFQLEGLGIVWDKIKPDILYGVKDTAYGLDVAAKAAAQLSASGIKVGTSMKTSLRAISGVAAMTNSSYEEMGRVFISAAGKGKVMGDELMSLSTRGLNAAADMAKYFNEVNSGARDTSKSVKESIKEITKGVKVGQADIQEMASKRLISYKVFAKVMDDLYGEHASKANETYTGSLSNVKAALSRLGAEVQSQKLKALQKVFVASIPVIDNFTADAEKAISTINNLVMTLSTKVVSVLTYLSSEDGRAWSEALAESVRIAASAISSFLSIIGKVGSKVFNLNKETFNAISSGINSALKKLNELLSETSPLWSVVENVTTKIFTSIKNIAIYIGKIIGLVGNLVRGSLGPLKKIIENVIYLADIFIFSIKDGFSEVFDATLLDIFKKSLLIIPTVLTRISKTIDELIKSGIQDYIADFSVLFQGFFVVLKNIGVIISGIIDLVSKKLPDIFKLTSDQDTVFHKLVHTLSELIRFIGEFLISLDGFGSTVVNVIESTLKIANPLLSLFKKILFGVGDAVEDVIGWFKKLKDGVQLVEKPVLYLKNLFNSLSPILDYFKDLFKGILKEINNALSNLTIGQNGNSLLGFVTLFNTAVLGLGGAKVLGSIKSVASSLDDVQGPIGKLLRKLDNIKTKIGDIFPFLGSLQQTLIEYQTNIKSKTLLKIAEAVALLAASMWLMSTIDADKLGAVFSTMAASMAGLLGSLYYLSNMNIKKTVNLEALSGVLVSLGVSVLLLATALKVLSTIDVEGLENGLVAIGGLMFEIGVFLKYMETNDKSGGFKTAILLLGMAASIKILASAMKQLADLDEEQLMTGLFAVGALIVGLAEATSRMPEKGMIQMGIGLIAVATSMLLFAKAIEKIGSMDLQTLGIGIGSIVFLLTGMVAAFTNMPEKGILKAGSALMIASIGIVAIAGAFKILDGLKNAWQSFGVLAVTLLSIAVACEVLNEAAKGAIGLSIAATSMVALAGALLMLNKVDYTSIIKLAFALGVIVAFSAIAQGIAVGMFVLAGSLLAVGAGIALLGVGVLALSAGLLSLAAGGTAVVFMLTEVLGLIPLFFQQLGYGISSFLVALGNSTGAIVQALTAIAGAFLDSINDLLPKFVELIGNLLDAGLTVLADWTPKIIDAGVYIVLEFLRGLEDATPELVDRTFTLITTFFDSLTAAIDAHAYELWNSLKNLFLTALKKVGVIILGESINIFNKGRELGEKFRLGVAELKDKIKNWFKEKIQDVIKWFGTQWNNFKNAGKNLVKGFLDGLESVPIIGTVVKIGRTAINALRGSLDEHSPSKKAKKAGKDFVKGFCIALDEGKATVKRSVKGLVASFMINGNKVQFFDATLKGVTKSTKEFVDKTVANITWGKSTINKYLAEFTKATKQSDGKYNTNTKTYKNAAKAVGQLSEKLYLNSEAYEESNRKVKDYASSIKTSENKLKKLETELKKVEKKRDKKSKKRAKELRNQIANEKKTLKELGIAMNAELKNIANGAKEAYQAFRESIRESISSAVDILKVPIKNFVNLFEEFGEVENIPVSNLLNTMRSQIVGISKWRSDLAALGKRKIAKGLLDQLRDMGPEAEKYIQSFLKMTDSELEQANLMFKAQNELTAQSLIDGIKDQFEAVQNWTNNIEKLAKRGLNFDLLSELQEAGPDNAEYVETLANMTAAQIKEINNLYAKAKSLPSSMADSILASLALSNQNKGDISGIKDTVSAVSQVLSSPEFTSSAEEAGSALTTAMSVGIKASEPDLVEASKLVGSSSLNEFTKYLSTENGNTIGINMVDGLVIGLKTGKEAIMEASQEVAEATYNAAAEELDIHSPSRKFMELGKNSDIGFADGLLKYATRVKKASEEAGARALSGMRESMAQISELLNKEYNRPVITPILDLSEVSNDANRINRLFNDQNIGVITDPTKEIQNGKIFNFTQNNYSPKALSRIEIYRQTKNLISTTKGAVLANG